MISLSLLYNSVSLINDSRPLGEECTNHNSVYHEKKKTVISRWMVEKFDEAVLARDGTLPRISSFERRQDCCYPLGLYEQTASLFGVLLGKSSPQH